MNLVQLQQKLMAVGRRDLPVDTVPYGFEQRVMTRLLSGPRVDELMLWARSLWIGAGACSVVALYLGIWCLTFPMEARESSGHFLQGVEETILAYGEEGEPSR